MDKCVTVAGMPGHTQYASTRKSTRQALWKVAKTPNA